MMGCSLDCTLRSEEWWWWPTDRQLAVQPSQQLKDTDCPPPTDCNYWIIIIIIIFCNYWIIMIIIIQNKINWKTHNRFLILNLRLRPK